MKYLFLVAFIALQFLSVVILKLLDSFWLIIAIYILGLLVGGVLYFSNRETKNIIRKNIAWGLFYGSITSLGLVVIFTIWLSFNFPK